MSFSESNEFSAESTDEAVIRMRLLVERLGVESTEEYAQHVRELYRGDNEHLPNILRMREIAQTIVQPMGGRMRSLRLADAFYWGELIAYRMQGLRGGPDWAFEASLLIEAELCAQTEIVQEFLDDKLASPILAPDFMIQMIENDLARTMSVGAEDTIVAVTEDLAARHDERWHAILGFRHIMTRLVDVPPAGRDESIDRLFAALVEASGLEDTSELQGFVSVNNVKEYVMERYAADEYLPLNFDRKDPFVIEGMREHLDGVVRRAFLEQDDLVAGDRIRIEGQVLFTVVETDSRRETVSFVSEGGYIDGTVEAFRVLSAPSSQAVLRFQNSHVQEDGRDDGVDPLGVVLLLKDVSIMRGEKVEAPADVPHTFRVVMANQKIDLLKYQAYTKG